MRKIQFDEKTIDAIRSYIAEGHTMPETCNRFTLKYDTLKRVMFENNIRPFYESRSHTQPVDPKKVQLVCNLYKSTKIRIDDIVHEAHLKRYTVYQILRDNFSQEFRDKRKASMYSESKRGDKNPMKGKFGPLNPNYKGLVEDGHGYYMVRKPEWYTGRKGSEYVFYHSVVMCESLGLTELPAGYVVHHIDFDKKNNDIANLALMTSGAHSKLHSLMRKMCKVQRLSEQE